MTSLRHNEPEAGSAADLALDAARESILAVGWSRTTLTDVARRAGVSRMTIYRKWPDMGALLELNVPRFLKGEPLLNTIDPTRAY